ncbi:aspartate aminotransferase family protein [Rhizobium ruizarguesonis]|uniref:Acetylornithine aminotransferase n=1 Tax=Rhizobium ruizarguesonis TaxID=2081791 RepID=A0AAE8Q8C8_9HYPH|nr:aspartate aminotransferase family protein [Rhizobium ruizarguesonis]MBY5830103.1 aspartate aminotransferase family protein [Rhizobium leguminosarum]QJS25972.1 aspartate aminotransferase family protein [Rhizobium leguminosarum bv. trifolii TA1]MBY5858555.1 aspartate aminotransferase family protein [Rhizobium leguminosarum]MBY5873467.1 aspartate aminotransferase family protein [Rhizobium leguminosarum]NEI20460.1 acetylornithine/succinylornithine family transaminase [Rhizobium ruizarguesonis]
MAEAAPLYDTYSRAPLRFERGEGVWLITESGERYLDFGAGVAVTSVGHSNPHVVGALKEQADKVWHLSNIYEIPGQERLAKRLTEATFADKVFFTNSGAEALECAIKTARRYQFSEGHPERFHIITFEGAFHGRTLATIAAGGQEKYLEGFGPKAPGFDQVPFGDIEAVRAAITDATAGILIEPVQGEGGVRPATTEFMKALRQLCDDNDLLLILDEVQTGVGRTGKLFAHEWAGITPDIMAVAKGIGGGFPLGACLATSEAASGMKAGTHGSTYGGNPLAMAVGSAVLDIILADGFLQHVRDVALVFRQGLASLKDRYPDVIEDIRGEGLLLGIKAAVPSAELLQAIRAAHLLGVPAGDNVIRLLPPLVVTAEEAREGLARVERAAESIRASKVKKTA